MVICHLCLCGPYTEGMNYQENILPKYHVKQGNKVFQIVNAYEWNDNKIVKSGDTHYINKYGVEVIRLKEKRGMVLGHRFDRYPELLNTLCYIEPDILFVHDVQFLDTSVVARYLKLHRQCRAYADNHTDYTNGIKTWISKNILHGIVWKHSAKQLEPYIRKFYGVLPARVEILQNLYKLPKEKCSLLVMGADDEIVKKAKSIEVRKDIREKYGIRETDFLVVTGGKINQNRPETLSLIEAIKQIDDKKVKLIVFGAVSDDLRNRFNELVNSFDRVNYIGWIESESTYDIFSAADLVVFPGLHSVMWEQAVAMGKPCIFRDLQGYHHVDLGDNAVFVDDVSCYALRDIIIEIFSNQEQYEKMRRAAAEKGMTNFSYDHIARICIEE